MTDPIIATIEDKLGHPLPAGYRRFLRESSEDDWRDFPILLHSYDLIIKRNLGARANPDLYLVRVREESGGWRLFDEPWPADWIIIGDNGGGDHWFIHRDESEPGIWFWSHESREAAADDRYLSFEMALAHGRAEAGHGPKPALEQVSHPLLGDMVWNSGDGHRSWSGAGRSATGAAISFCIQVPSYLKAEGAQLQEILEAVAPAVARAIAATPNVIEAALPDLGEIQHRIAARDGKSPKLTPDQLRAILASPMLNAHYQQEGLTLSYVCPGGEPFGWNLIDIEVNADLEYEGLQIY